MSLVGTAGKHSLGRVRKSQVEADPEGHALLLGQAGSGCSCQVSPLGEGRRDPPRPRCPGTDESGKDVPSAPSHGPCMKPRARAPRGSAQNRGGLTLGLLSRVSVCSTEQKTKTTKFLISVSPTANTGNASRPHSSSRAAVVWHDDGASPRPAPGPGV